MKRPWQFLYGTAWRKARFQFLCDHPLCAEHQRHGLIEPATCVDHVVPHKGDQALFWDESNWESACDECHNSRKQAIEKGNVQAKTWTVRGARADGTPCDPTHHWNSQ